MKTIDRYCIDWIHYAFPEGFSVSVLEDLRIFLSLCTQDEDFIEDGVSFAYEFDIVEKELGETITWLLINVLGKNGIITCGSSIKLGFLTDSGEKLREYLVDKDFDKYLYFIANYSKK